MHFNTGASHLFNNCTDTQVVDPDIDANNDTAFALVDGTGSLTFLANHRIQTVFPGEWGWSMGLTDPFVLEPGRIN